METLIQAFPALIGFLFVAGIPYAIYRAIKGLMTHSANLKKQRESDSDKDPLSR